MFGTVRCLIGGIFFVAFLLIIKRIKPKKGKLFNISLLICTFIIVCVLNFIPFENVFYTFSSPEKAYNYFYSEKKEISIVVEGEKTDFVCGREGVEMTHLIIPKSDKGWKVGLGADTKNIKNTFKTGVSYNIYQYKNTNEYYIFLLDVSGEKATVTDSLDSNFVESSIDDGDEIKYIYYAYIPEYNEEYVVTINGRQVKL